jgi:hypothetical protein
LDFVHPRDIKFEYGIRESHPNYPFVLIVSEALSSFSSAIVISN